MDQEQNMAKDSSQNTSDSGAKMSVEEVKTALEKLYKEIEALGLSDACRKIKEAISELDNAQGDNEDTGVAPKKDFMASLMDSGDEE